MENLHSPDTLIAPSSLTLPKGGGTLQGMQQSLSSVGSFGMAGMSVPLPVSPGRGFAPALALQYSSGGENGLFGHGWNVAVMRVSRVTRYGVPRYNADDLFLGPGDEELVVERDKSGKVVTTTCARYADQDLGQTYTVTRYSPRGESAFHRLEHWSANNDAGFWLLHEAGGVLHCLGKSPQARLADPGEVQHVAEWWLEESLSPDGQRIRYCYRDDCQTAALARVCYGNRQAADSLDAWSPHPLKEEEWLFTLLFDYGERGSDLQKLPTWSAEPHPLSRQDPQRRYEYGFPCHIDLLCRQILMFHSFDTLNNGAPQLITRMVLDFDENPVMTQLVGIQTVSYDPQKKRLSLPPLDLRYSAFSLTTSATRWQPLEALSAIKDNQHYQLVDLYGEGLPGLLWHDERGWYYRAPERGETAGSVRYGPLQRLPVNPAFTGHEMALLDFTGDGRLDWVVQRPGLAGYFTLNAGRQWSGFIPFNAWPAEFLSASAQLMDLTGAGLQDLVLIGPKSVRLYENKRQGFGRPDEVAQADDVLLPAMGRDVTELVVFSDVLGSGQQHLVSIRHNAVTCWPNLGHGKFGSPIILPGLTLDEKTFVPAQVHLADIDGSGAVDIIYAESDRLRLFHNQSGQRFIEGAVLPLPPGVRYDRLCQLQCVDLDGAGVTSLVLTVPYMSVRHWRYTFTDQKPYLLMGMNNNMGADTQLYYDNSAQCWLDEKKETPQAVCHLPFPVQLLVGTKTVDEVTGNCLTQRYQFRRGVYDGTERKFRGFGCVEAWDTDENAQATGTHQSACRPLRTCTWYHTGREEDELSLPAMSQKLWMPYRLPKTRLTTWEEEADRPWDPGSEDIQLKAHCFRALQGQVLRQELYDADDSPLTAVPYSVMFYRYQVRVVQPGYGEGTPVIFPAPLETLNYYYDRIDSDPKISQEIQLQRDAFGATLHHVAIAYPRRMFSELKNYAAGLTDEGFAATEDEQQYILWLNEHRTQVHHFAQEQRWCLAIPVATRHDVLQYCPQDIPPGGITADNLLQDSGLLATARPRIFNGQTRWEYEGALQTLPVLLSYTETAELDDICLQAFDGVLEGEERDKTLLAGGYIKANKVLDATSESPSIWVARRGFTERHGREGFYLPRATRGSLLVGKTSLTWDRYFCAVTEVKDAAGHRTQAEYDYRFLTPWKVIDINDNTSEVALDAFGRVLASSFYGTEGGEAVGFHPVKEFSPPEETLPVLLDNPVVPQGVASYIVADIHSWMGKLEPGSLDDKVWAELLAAHKITAEGYVRSSARYQSVSGATVSEALLMKKMTDIKRIPVNNAVFIADNYPDKPQTIRRSVIFYDGFSRVLQTAQRHEPGEAYVRDASGQLVVSEGAPTTPKTHPTGTRWAVSGRVEYNNKGMPVRSYLPFFVNDWRYIADDALRINGYADCHFYDPVGRETSVITAKKYLRRQGYYPWFQIAEDENDTAAEQMAP